MLLDCDNWRLKPVPQMGAPSTVEVVETDLRQQRRRGWSGSLREKNQARERVNQREWRRGDGNGDGERGSGGVLLLEAERQSFNYAVSRIIDLACLSPQRRRKKEELVGKGRSASPRVLPPASYDDASSDLKIGVGGDLQTVFFPRSRSGSTANGVLFPF
ncbi:unnamed protein product [Linum trigynum]|uniref:Uncharacterized protein n=1 Tax=Linum trigynum TaxID=586398 RepID=A0AAV2CIF0_9ROSI